MCLFNSQSSTPKRSTKPGRTAYPSSMLRITTRHLNCCDLTSMGLLTVLDTGATPCAIAGTDFRLWLLIFRSGCRMTPSLLGGAKNSDQKRQKKIPRCEISDHSDLHNKREKTIRAETSLWYQCLVCRGLRRPRWPYPV